VSEDRAALYAGKRVTEMSKDELIEALSHVARLYENLVVAQFTFDKFAARPPADVTFRGMSGRISQEREDHDLHQRHKNAWLRNVMTEHYASSYLRVGDPVVLENPPRRWWQLWKRKPIEDRKIESITAGWVDFGGGDAR
jgi:hypothetical protein